jgi:hypothetical protein
MNTKEDDMKTWADGVLLSLLGKEHSEKWWHNPNKAFNNSTPESQWKTDPDSVCRYLYQFINGDYF